MMKQGETNMDNEGAHVTTDEASLANLLALLAQAQDHAYAGRSPAQFPGLDSYVPSFVSSGADSQGSAGAWEIGTKSSKR